MRFWTGETINELKENQIFVFGSNPEGRHGAGAAKAAMSFGAKYGTGRGLSGNTYALITKNLTAGYTEKSTGITYAKDGYNSLSVEQIKSNIKDLYDTAKSMPDKIFVVVYKNDTWPNGSPKKSLNGYTGEQMWDMFTKDQEVPANMVFHASFKPLLKFELTQSTTQSSNNEQDDKFTFFFSPSNPFSQWYPSKFEYKGLTFISGEQFMMYSKAKMFGDNEIAERIMSWNTSNIGKDFINGYIDAAGIVNNPVHLKTWKAMQTDIKALGREVENYDDAVWSAKRVPVVFVGNREKYSQNPELKDLLMATKGTRLVEASPYDKIWGIGLKDTDPKAKDPSKWNGLNLLGDHVLTPLRTLYENELTEKKTNIPRKMKP